MINGILSTISGNEFERVYAVGGGTVIDIGNQINEFIEKIPGPTDDNGRMKAWGDTNSGKINSFF